MKKLPFLKAFAQAWFGDKQLRLCSEGARGIWWELCLIMHDEGQPYGHLAKGGAPYPEGDLLKTLNLTAARYRKYLQELESRQIFSRTADGVIYSRRLVRDKEVRDQAALDGAKGAMHPNHPSQTLKSRRGATLKGHPTGHPIPPPINNRVIENRSSKGEISVEPVLQPPSASDIAAREAALERIRRDREAVAP